jgi:hypothetical protein
MFVVATSSLFILFFFFLLEIQTGKLEQNIESSDIRSFEKKTEKWREKKIHGISVLLPLSRREKK